jgi:hypothetical protein
MVCEKCAAEMDTVRCQGCGSTIIKLGPYCYSCGSALKVEIVQTGDDEFDLSQRILCSDGNCIGVVENGTCKLCGKPYVPEG